MQFICIFWACLMSCESRSVVSICDPMDCSLSGSSALSMEFSRQEYWSGLPCPPLGDFPTQGSNPGLPHCRQILYCLSYQGSPGIMEWVAYPFSRGSSQPRNQISVSCFAGGFFTSWATRKAWCNWISIKKWTLTHNLHHVQKLAQNGW